MTEAETRKLLAEAGGLKLSQVEFIWEQAVRWHRERGILPPADTTRNAVSVGRDSIGHDWMQVDGPEDIQCRKCGAVSGSPTDDDIRTCKATQDITSEGEKK